MIHRPWESINFFSGWPIQKVYAIIMILFAIGQGKFIISHSPTNKWVFSLLSLHFILIPFAYNAGYAFDEGVEYAKNVVFYVLLISFIDDEENLKIVITAFALTMFLYVFHSLWEFNNGRHVYRMGIARMVGVDSTFSDPNTFSASVVLSLPFFYTLLKFETHRFLRYLYYSYFGLAMLCIVLTGSRTAFVAMGVVFFLWVFKQKGATKAKALAVVVILSCLIWISMPEDKKIRIETLWDSDIGPKNAHTSATGRLEGLKASWKMFKQRPFTGVGPGGKNFIEYRVKNIDGVALQSHVLYGEIIAELGIMGAIFFLGLIYSIWRCCQSCLRVFKKYLGEQSFCSSLTHSILACLILLLFFGFGGHNFYRPLWLWIAAWSGSLFFISNKIVYGESNSK